jgi:hypothetical protein
MRFWGIVRGTVERRYFSLILGIFADPVRRLSQAAW